MQQDNLYVNMCIKFFIVTKKNIFVVIVRLKKIIQEWTCFFGDLFPFFNSIS